MVQWNARFAALPLPNDARGEGAHGIMRYKWLGRADEDIMVCVPSFATREPFHCHEYFYFMFTMAGQYDAISHSEDGRITIHEDELYAGEPAAPHALITTGDAKE